MPKTSALSYLRQLGNRYFSDPQAMILALVLLVITLALLGFQFFGSLIASGLGNILAPVLSAIVLAYLLEGLVGQLQKLKVNRKLAVGVVYVVFIASLAFALLALIPLLYQQSMTFVRNLPMWILTIGDYLRTLPEKYPALVSENFIRDFINAIDSRARDFAREAPLFFFRNLPFVFTFIIYLILIPLLIFFMLWDKEKILIWLRRFVPRERTLLNRVWSETNVQIANYIRGKFWEILIVGIVTWICFRLLGMNYAALLGTATGLSVLVPYVGATVVTIPIAIVAYVQWGFGNEFWVAMTLYFIIQTLDANVLVPILFSKVNNLHPVAIIVAVVFFGGIGGVLGVLFAIPLATLIKAILSAWPDPDAEESPAALEAPPQSEKNQGAAT
jgi:putative permease